MGERWTWARASAMDTAMKRLVLAILAAAALYSAFWVWSARDLRRQVSERLETLRAAGVEVTYDRLSLRGFPSRLDLGFEGLAVAGPDGLRIESPLVQALQTVWQRDRWILVLPTPVAVSGPGRVTTTIRPEAMRASLGRELVLEATSVRLDSGETMLSSGPLLLAVRPESGGAARLFLRATDLASRTQAPSELVFDGLLTFAEPIAWPALLPLPELEATEVTTLTYADTSALADALRPAFPDLAAALDQRQ